MPTYTREPPATAAKPPVKPGLLRGRTLGWQAAVITVTAVLALFAAGAVKSWIFPAPDGPTQVTPPASTQPVTPAVPPTAPLAPGQAPSVGGWSYPAPGLVFDLVSAPDTMWTLVGGMAAPSSPAAGPAFTDPVRYGYAPTPAGALFAVGNYLAQMQSPSATPAWEIDLANHAMADTPARTKFLAVWAANPTPTPVPANVQDIRASFVAFHFISYSPDMAMVDIASSWNGHLDAASYTVRFSGGDWLLDPPDTGRFPMRQLPVEDARYWTHWAAG